MFYKKKYKNKKAVFSRDYIEHAESLKTGYL